VKLGVKFFEARLHRLRACAAAADPSVNLNNGETLLGNRLDVHTNFLGCASRSRLYTAASSRSDCKTSYKSQKQNYGEVPHLSVINRPRGFVAWLRFGAVKQGGAAGGCIGSIVVEPSDFSRFLALGGRRPPRTTIARSWRM
jgi:hypothetical protein